MDPMSTFSVSSCCEVSTNLYFLIVTGLVVNCLTTTQFTAGDQFECEISQKNLWGRRMNKKFWDNYIVHFPYIKSNLKYLNPI
jgi:hypothetical protein